MRHRSSLRKRIASAYLLLAVLLSGCFSIVAYLTVKNIEDKLIGVRLVAAADRLIENYLKGIDAAPLGNLTVSPGDAIAAELRSLPPGLHEIDLKGQALHVLIQQRGDEIFALVDDESEY